MSTQSTAKMDGQGEETVAIPLAVSSPTTTTLTPAHPNPNPDPAPPTAPISPLLRLPPELLSLTLAHVPAQLHQRTALALHKVFPGYGLAEEHVWRHVVVKRGEQLMPLWKAARGRRDEMRRRMREEARERRMGKLVEGGEESGGARDGAAEVEEVEEDTEGPEGRLALGRRMGTQSFAMDSWRGDADLLNNALRCLPHLPVIKLNLGTNFAPEHLDDMFDEPRLGLERLEMRFRPYVEQASYYQFLKGSYFDTAIETLTRSWPELPSFTHLSIVQDPPPRLTAPPTAMSSMAASAMTSAAASTLPSASTSTVSSPHTAAAQAAVDKIAKLNLDSPSSSEDESSDDSTPATSVSDSPAVPKGYTGHGPFPYLSERIAGARPKSFAQPIVFFDVYCLATFGLAPVARHLTHLRLRVPSRNIAAVLCGPDADAPPLFPALTYLDISTTNVRLDMYLSTLLKRYEKLEHLVLDRVNLFGFQARDRGPELCRELGGVVLSACLARGKERERTIANWDTAERARIARAQAEARRAQAGGSAREESLIDQAQREAQLAAEERERQLALARSRRGHRSAAQSTFSMRDRPSRFRPSAAGPSATAAGPLPPTDRLYLVLPPLPTLKSLGIGGESQHVSQARTREWAAEFQSGWRDGLGKVQGWAGHVGERYERAKKKAEEWIDSEARNALSGSGRGGGVAQPHVKGAKGKGKAVAAAKVTPTKPPTDVRLFRFPFPGEKGDVLSEEPVAGLVELFPIGKEYLDVYRDAMADAEMHANDYSYAPACVLCTVPDCEGPARRSDEGGRVDGRGGMAGRHVEGCGHAVGRAIWGWAGM